MTFWFSGLALEADTLAKAGVVVAVAKAAIQKADQDPGTIELIQYLLNSLNHFGQILDVSTL